MKLHNNYFERVYAGVLGKMIGVYLGRPFEGWSYEKIMSTFGEIDRYVNNESGDPLVVTDDDLTGTFTFIRALEDHNSGRKLTAAQIGQTWLNYVIENRTIFWWGGIGSSTEHTAFIRLKQGFEAPASGQIATNGEIVAEQIGAQIFIDCWGMVAPGDPELAADLAKRAASVGHDREAIYGAQIIAVMESLAFIEEDRFKILDAAVKYIPSGSAIYKLIQELQDQHVNEADWRKTREWIEQNYGYDKYIGDCHMIPNHALIILGLLYGDDDFSKSLMITNTSGWDTDCNSENLGCIMGIKLGLDGIDQSEYDWRKPIADRLLLPTSVGGNSITDGLREAIRITNIGRSLVNEEPIMPKNGARFNFCLPGSIQGFKVDTVNESDSDIIIENTPSQINENERVLRIKYPASANGNPVRVTTPTFILPEEAKIPYYPLYASPTLYSALVHLKCYQSKIVSSNDNVTGAGDVRTRRNDNRRKTKVSSQNVGTISRCNKGRKTSDAE